MKLPILISGFFLLFLSACDQGRDNNIIEDKLKAGEPYFSIVYSRDFANRFKLPTSDALTLPDYQMAVAVEINEVDNLFTCDLHLYINSSLDIFIPADGAYFSGKIEAEQFFISSYNDKDQEWNSSLLENNSLRVRFESREIVSSEHRFIKTLEYKRIHENFLPGLTMVTFDTHCDIFEKQYYPADIWIQKNGLEGYLLGNDQFGSAKQVDQNHWFEIPLKLVEQIQPYLVVALQQNAKRKGW